ncbi:hypothetical protein ACJIZ3_019053 [Penstemon smallii]|uniref:Pulmonary surfactant-associated protein B n=1 Tax=Penstemon smallii TaxID=265156 RepID=A0ABD3T0R6_9LAMI
MDTRVLLLLFIFSSCWCCNARDLTVPQSHTEGEAQHVGKISGNENLCTLCEEFTAEALNYLSENKTQTEIISTLHKSCSKIPSFKQQCIVLVDYYAPLFFLEVSNIQAEDFCQKVALCEKDVSISLELPKGTCDVCHDAVTEALLKLKDPDTELEILQVLLKACDKIGKAVKKCKRLVFEYAPIILVNAEQFLETNDVCTILHACDSTDQVTSMHAAS